MFITDVQILIFSIILNTIKIIEKINKKYTIL